MPEVIEVREYRDFIRRRILGKRLTQVKILNGRYKKHGPPKGLKSDLITHLPQKVIDVDSKGKFMWITFESGVSMGVTLGLSGGWFFQKSKSKSKQSRMIHGLDGQRYVDTNVEKYRERALKHLNVEFRFGHAGTLYFYDQLSYGTIAIFPDAQSLEKKLKGIGLDMMAEETTFDQFEAAIMRPSAQKKPIGNVLMNQKYISGIGNYLRADTLWMSKVSPFRPLGKVTRSELQRIFENARKLIWGQYDKKRGQKLGIIKRSDKLPLDYGRTFFVYQYDTDVMGREVKKEKLYEGSQVRFIFYVPGYQK